MKLSEIVVADAVITELSNADRDAVVGELVDSLVEAGAIEKAQRDAVFNAIIERERRGSTGFGKGVAVPHVRHPQAERVSLAIGLSQRGVDFNSLDKQPVYTVFLLVSPANKHEEHLRAMEVIFKNLSMDTFRRFLRQASNKDEVISLLAEADGRQFTA
jgi:mannitol/fructose-specific phosphotransferase system IIA component (Ntr-type)